MNSEIPKLISNEPGPTACRRLKYAIEDNIQLYLVGLWQAYDPSIPGDFVPDSVWYARIYRGRRHLRELECLIADTDIEPTPYLEVERYRDSAVFTIRHRMLGDFAQMVVDFNRSHNHETTT